MERHTHILIRVLCFFSRALSREELLTNLKVCQNNLHCDRLPNEFKEIQEKIQEFIDKFENIDGNFNSTFSKSSSVYTLFGFQKYRF